MPNYGKFLKELVNNKQKIEQISAAFLSDESSAILQNKVPAKLRDPKGFLIPCNFNKAFSYNALADLGASINLMLYSLYAKLSLETLKPTKMSVRLADRSFEYPVGIAENMLVEVGKFTYPADFVILEMEENSFSIDVIDEILEEDFDALLDEESVEVFMDDFSVFGSPFDHCLNNLDKMLQRCKDTHLVLNWKKCHFMVKEGIMLGHKVSKAGLEVDKAKINVISKLPPPTNIKGIRSFLRHAGFYRRFIKDFSKIACPLTKLLEKDTLFEFNDEYQNAFKILKEKLTCAPVIVSPNWSLLFVLMYDASDFAVGAILEFDIEIKDRKGTENVAADHLSQIENEETSDDSEVNDNFPGETLMEINT
ncbi:reverse transcriptase domain-containing protein [Tanacetum coccineum]